MRGMVILLAVIGMLMPVTSFGQDVAEKINSLHGILDELYDDMMPLCEQLITVARGIAGFGALWYICSRVWKHLASAEPIDFYPLFRPFCLGLCITLFSGVLTAINTIMKPTVTGTAEMVRGSEMAVAVLLKQKEEAIKESPIWKMYVGETGSGDRAEWYKYTHDDESVEKEKWYESVGNSVSFAMAKMSYRLKNNVKEWMSEVLKILFQAAALCINTLRTFQLVVLSILGPLVFGLAVYDGFQHTLTAWLSRYINVFLWLPVCNIFGAIISKIQEKMLKLDLGQIKDTGDTFFSATDTGYLIFMLIGIVGYFTVPSVAGFIVNAGGGGGMLQRVTSIATSTPGAVMSTAMGAGSYAKEAMGNYANMGRYFDEGLSGKESGAGLSGMIGRAAGRAYMANKLDGGDSAKSRGQ